MAASGWISVLVLLVIMIGVTITKDMLLESMARAEFVVRLRDAVTAGDAGPLIRQSWLRITSARKFEITDMFDVHVGSTWKRNLYMAGYSMYQLGILVAFSSVFASSLSANVSLKWLTGVGACNVEHSPECISNFYVWLLVFALFAVPMACMDLSEQKIVQMVMTGVRVVVVVLIVGTTLGAMSCDADGGVAFIETDNDMEIPPEWYSTVLRPAGLGVIVPIGVYALVFHHAIPTISADVRPKKALGKVFSAAFMICALCYSLIGVVTLMYFGDHIDAQANLMWGGYLGCAHRDALGNLPGPTPAASAAAMVILLCPALDVLSAYAPSSVTLANVLLSLMRSDASSGGRGGALVAAVPGGSPVPVRALDMDDASDDSDSLPHDQLLAAKSDAVRGLADALSLGNTPLPAAGSGEPAADGSYATAAGQPASSDSCSQSAESTPAPAAQRVRSYSSLALRESGGPGRGSPAGATVLAGPPDAGPLASPTEHQGLIPSSNTQSSPIRTPGVRGALRRLHRRVRAMPMLPSQKLGIRLISAVPPILITAMLHSLDTVLEFTGVVGIGIALVVPPYLLLAARARTVDVCRWAGERWLDQPNVAPSIVEESALSPSDSVGVAVQAVGPANVWPSVAAILRSASPTASTKELQPHIIQLLSTPFDVKWIGRRGLLISVLCGGAITLAAVVDTIVNVSEA